MNARIKSRFPREKMRGNPTPCRHAPVILYTGRTLTVALCVPFGPKPAPGAGFGRTAFRTAYTQKSGGIPRLARVSARTSIFQPGDTPCVY